MTAEKEDALRSASAYEHPTPGNAGRDGSYLTPHGGAPATGQVVTNDSIDTALCTLDGVEHDFRPRTYDRWGKPHTSWVCVWCNGVACGDWMEPDPCWRVYHHDGGHRSRAGIEWPLGGNRPDTGCP